MGIYNLSDNYPKGFDRLSSTFCSKGLRAGRLSEGEAIITELTIQALESKTIGKFKIVKLYNDEHRKVWNENMQPAEY